MISAADKAYYAEETRLAILRLNHHYAARASVPKITWSLRGTSRLGCARGISEILLNEQFAAALGRDEYRKVVLHEVCHIVTTWRRVQTNNSRPRNDRNDPWSAHGSEWRQAMRVLGQVPKASYRIPPEVAAQLTPGRKTKTHKVVCGCQVHELSSVRYSRVLAGAKYTCKGCKQVVAPFRLVNGVVERIAV